jgi:hypothetical protein
MSQRIRRCLAALSLGVALLMATPATSWASGIADWQIAVLLSGRAWHWVAKVWPGGGEQAHGRRSGTVQGKEGSVIDPNGTSGDPVPPLPTSDPISEEGSVIDPNG